MKKGDPLLRPSKRRGKKSSFAAKAVQPKNASDVVKPIKIENPRRRETELYQAKSKQKIGPSSNYYLNQCEQ